MGVDGYFGAGRWHDPTERGKSPLWQRLAMVYGQSGTAKGDAACGDRKGFVEVPQNTPRTDSRSITPQMLSYREDGVDDKGQPFVYSRKGPEDGSMHPALWNGKPSGQSGAKKEQ